MIDLEHHIGDGKLVNVYAVITLMSPVKKSGGTGALFTSYFCLRIIFLSDYVVSLKIKDATTNGANLATIPFGTVCLTRKPTPFC